MGEAKGTSSNGRSHPSVGEARPLTRARQTLVWAAITTSIFAGCPEGEISSMRALAREKRPAFVGPKLPPEAKSKDREGHAYFFCKRWIQWVLQERGSKVIFREWWAFGDQSPQIQLGMSWCPNAATVRSFGFISCRMNNLIRSAIYMIWMALQTGRDVANCPVVY
jgi:hypothetical protein